MSDVYCNYCLLFYAHAASRIEQVYPLNTNYCCHCPNIELMCTFSENPFTASWTVLRNGVPDQVTDGTPGHTVNRSQLQNGILVLHVNHTMYSKHNIYSCTALYVDGTETEETNSFVIPMDEG